MTMEKFTIKRTASTIQGVFGMLVDKHGWQVCLTGERPWLDNKRSVSCIPAGTYKCTKYDSPSRKYEVALLHGVDERDMIEIHAGNKPLEDSEGCILLGMGLGQWDNQPTVTDSKKAFKKFMDMADDEFILQVENCYHG
jgi:hypothetical protein